MGVAATGPYMDDFTTVDFMAANGSAQSFTNLGIRTLEGSAQAPKRPARYFGSARPHVPHARGRVSPLRAQS
eukprot:13513201-Heterocapsa_arctica.AAC.1